MLNPKLLSLLGLCARARKISSGSILIDMIRKHKVYYVLIAQDASENTKKKIKDKCLYYHVDFQIMGDSEEISHAIGKSQRMAIGITDKGFADKIKSM